jgi:hypothetical protein
MREVPQALARLLLGDRLVAHAAARQLSERHWWLPAVALAGAWRVTPQLRRRVAALSVVPDDAAQQRLHAASIAAALQSTSLAHRAATVLGRLHDTGVPAVAFKGVAVIAGLYPGPGQRMINDIDVLVTPDRTEQACEVLKALGFVPVVDRLNEYIEYLEQRPYEGAFSGNCFLVLMDADQHEVDLHWRLGTRPPPSLAAGAIIARAQAAQLYGTTIRVAAPADAIVLTAHHVLRDNFAPDTTVKDLCDLAAWWEVEGTRWRVAEVVIHAQRCGMSVPLLALWKILTSFDAESRARDGVEQLAAVCAPRERGDATRLADLFHAQVAGGRLNPDLLRLLSPTVIVRFLSRRVHRGAAVDYFTRQLEAEMHLEPHRSYAQRVGRLFRDVVRLRARTLSAYRALLRVHRMSQLR